MPHGRLRASRRSPSGCRHLLLLLACAGSACHGDRSDSRDSGVARDGRDQLSAGDARADTPQIDPNAIGRPCTDNAQCGPSAACLITSPTLGGVCVAPCSPDDPNTPLVNEDTCPNLRQNICGFVTLSGGQRGAFCLRRCQPKLGANDCDAPLACDPRSSGSAGAPNRAVCLRIGCQDDVDCPVTNGQSCDPTAEVDTCSPGGECLALAAGSTAGVCVEPGTCDAASGLCGAHATDEPDAAIGDPCESDKDCGEFMTCEQEFDPQAILGERDHGAACDTDANCCGRCNPQSRTCEGSCVVHARNGYCLSTGCALATETEFRQYACPNGATCHRLFFGGICVKSCSLAQQDDCRGVAEDQLGDYECRAWNSIFDGAIADGPVCEFGDWLPCDLLGGSELDCSSVGTNAPTTNATEMTCRSSDGKATEDPGDPQGFCLDTTGSAPQPEQ